MGDSMSRMLGIPGRTVRYEWMSGLGMAVEEGVTPEEETV